MTDHTDIMVAIRQGSYYRLDAKRYMFDTEYCQWYLPRTGGRVETKKARKEHNCNCCTHPIFPGSAYLAIFYGKGLGSLKFPDNIHTWCLKDYTDKRKMKLEELNGQTSRTALHRITRGV